MAERTTRYSELELLPEVSARNLPPNIRSALPILIVDWQSFLLFLALAAGSEPVRKITDADVGLVATPLVIGGVLYFSGSMNVTRDGTRVSRAMPGLPDLTDRELDALRHFIRRKVHIDAGAGPR